MHERIRGEAFKSGSSSSSQLAARVCCRRKEAPCTSLGARQPRDTRRDTERATASLGIQSTWPHQGTTGRADGGNLLRHMGSLLARHNLPPLQRRVAPQWYLLRVDEPWEPGTWWEGKGSFRLGMSGDDLVSQVRDFGYFSAICCLGPDWCDCGNRWRRAWIGSIGGPWNAVLPRLPLGRCRDGRCCLVVGTDRSGRRPRPSGIKRDADRSRVREDHRDWQRNATRNQFSVVKKCPSPNPRLRPMLESRRGSSAMRREWRMPECQARFCAAAAGR